MKCGRYCSENMSTVVQADEVEFATPADCGGVLIRNASFIFFRLKIKKGGMDPPIALIAHTIVVSSPRSCDAVEPTCFFPFTLITFLNSSETTLIKIPDV